MSRRPRRFRRIASSLAVGRLDGSLAVYNTSDGASIPPTPPDKPELASLSPRGDRARQSGSSNALREKTWATCQKVAFSDGRLTGKVASSADNG